jgi:hypothetical protein
MKENYLAECLEKFHELPEETQEIIGGFSACLEIKKIEEAYNTSLSFAVILISVGELNINDLPEYLSLKFNLEKDKGVQVAELLLEKIFDPAIELIAELMEKNSETNEDVSFKEIDKEDLLNIFTDKIIPTIKAEKKSVQGINVYIFHSINEDDGLDDKLEDLLYKNQEKISSHSIILDGHPASSSISNWLKDFIRTHGSDLFNEVVLAEYLSQSLNAKSLKPEEKELLRKVLKLYRNLVFFPESMEGIPLENWEIFPVEHSSDDRIVVKSVVQEPKMTERQKVIFDLQKNLTKYSSSSLEYKAISQEISRLNRQ